ncbi:hypothetical protein FHD44_20650 [Escherichia coli]|nr:hypothetical protein [Escherichia coli]
MFADGGFATITMTGTGRRTRVLDAGYPLCRVNDVLGRCMDRSAVSGRPVSFAVLLTGDLVIHRNGV